MNFFLGGQRSSGVLAHFTSLPSPFGIGDIGHSSRRFLSFLQQANQTYWQFLPTGPTNAVFGHSPYMSSSAFAGSPLLICPQSLQEIGLAEQSEITGMDPFSAYRVDFDRVTDFKKQLLQKGYLRFNKQNEQFQQFVSSTPWLYDYALFMTLKEVFNHEPWFAWPEPLKNRDEKALNEFKQKHNDEVDYFCFEQFIFSSQWQQLRAAADLAGIKLFGDIPIYVGLDSADVWAHQDIFTLDAKTGRPTHVAGVPPDYFSETGQRWGTPLYRWQTTEKNVRKQLLSWWTSRFQAIFNMVDTARIDHFRGFESYWAIPEEEETAVNGKWLKGPGKPFFDAVFKKLGRLEIVAEDLGIITEEVNTLKDSLSFPGMKVLQFAFDNNPANTFLPHNFTGTNSVIYTGTHDNDTTLGWFLSEQVTELDRRFIKRYVNGSLNDLKPIHQDLIHLAFSSISSLAIIPLQDILGFGNDCRMNVPGTSEGNWLWRCGGEFLTGDTAAWVNKTTEMFGRGRLIKE